MHTKSFPLNEKVLVVKVDAKMNNGRATTNLHYVSFQSVRFLLAGKSQGELEDAAPAALASVKQMKNFHFM